MAMLRIRPKETVLILGMRAKEARTKTPPRIEGTEVIMWDTRTSSSQSVREVMTSGTRQVERERESGVRHRDDLRCYFYNISVALVCLLLLQQQQHQHHNNSQPKQNNSNKNECKKVQKNMQSHFIINTTLRPLITGGRLPSSWRRCKKA
jgi:hypothetical protein